MAFYFKQSKNGSDSLKFSNKVKALAPNKLQVFSGIFNKKFSLQEDNLELKCPLNKKKCNFLRLI
jgi:hypothetical protein